MTHVATYSTNAVTKDNVELILSTRPGCTASYLIRELIAAEAERLRNQETTTR